MNYEELLTAYNALKKENAFLKSEVDRLSGKMAGPQISLFESETKNFSGLPDFSPSKIHAKSKSEEKIELFMSLFRGRSDVYARRYYNEKTKIAGYTPVCGNQWRQGLCDMKKYKCAACPNRKLLPLERTVIEAHLRGDNNLCKDVIGVYPLLQNETCYFLAMDFDGENWREDVTAVRSLCSELNIPVSIERSRSGNGAHAWFFFEMSIAASTARKFGGILLTRAMSRRHEISFRSYDRLLPNQDTMPKGGFGNLIALPLQGRARKDGNSVFVDENFTAYTDQWAYLSSVKRLVTSDVDKVIDKFHFAGELGTLATIDDEEEKKPWEKAKPENLSRNDFPDKVNIVRAGMLHVEKKGISQRALNRIKRLAAFKNPEFYKAQAMRLSTYKKSRIIWTLDETAEYLSIPRGCETALVDLLKGSAAEYSINDKRNDGQKIKVEFVGELNAEQKLAAGALTKHDIGVLSAATAFGKTVIGANIIAVKKVNALVLVHTQALLIQWKKALDRFLVIDEMLPEQPQKRGRKKICSVIGQIGAGIDRRSGIMDVAVMQSLLLGEDGVKEFVKDYGLILVDECHHVAAFSFEKILKYASAKYVYGLTATPTRQDGHHPIIFMQCGPVRFKVDAKAQADKRSFEHYVVPRFTGFKKPVSYNETDWSITQIYADLAENEMRNRRIVDDAVKNLEAGRSPIILTGRSAHVTVLSDMLRPHCPNVITLVGSSSQKEKRETAKRLAEIDRGEPMIIVATGKYVGEGFDCPRLDTLLLAMPVAWKGTIAQYAGRLHRQYEGKNEVVIYDYVDVHVPVLEKMYHKRVKGYAQIGYKAMPESSIQEKTNIIFDENSFQSVFSSDLAAARKEIVIASPFMKPARVRQMIMQTSGALLNGASITVVTRPPENFTGEGRRTVHELTRLLGSANIKVVFKSKMHQKYTIIDQKIVWYGSVNFLSYGFGEESVMRLESYEIASELLEIS